MMSIEAAAFFIAIILVGLGAMYATYATGVHKGTAQATACMSKTQDANWCLEH